MILDTSTSLLRLRYFDYASVQVSTSQYKFEILDFRLKICEGLMKLVVESLQASLRICVAVAADTYHWLH